MNGEKKNILHQEGTLKVLVAVVCGTLFNVLCSRLVLQLDIPIYLDTIGTVVVAAMGGYFPGILTSVFSNVLNGYYDDLSVYYTLLNAMIAVVVAYAFRRGRLYNRLSLIELVAALAGIGGILGGVVTWYLTGPADSGITVEIMRWQMNNLGLSVFLSHIVTTFGFDLMDKALTVFFAMLIIRIIPQSVKEEIDMFGWQQRPLPYEKRQELKAKGAKGSRSMRARVTFMLVVSILLIAIAVTWVSTKTFSAYLKQEHLKTAEGATRLAASEIAPNMVDTYIREGDKAPGYKAVEDKLQMIRESSPDIDYLYVYRIEEKGCRVVFDLDTDELEGDDPGTLIDFDDDFKPYLSDLLAGKPIDPMVSNGKFGWLLTYYHPLYSEDGKCECYVAADISMHGLQGYENDFLLRIILVFSGFFTLILAFTLWVINYYLVLPINSMAECAEAFAFDSDDDRSLEDHLERIHGLEISTGDEVENLYRAFCKMTEDSAMHVADIERQAKTIDEMQKGLIITMADMVEGRDSDTGDHVRKTAAYADIILKGLKKKGYYQDELSDKFMSDVVQSAPLHDIGKINVSDTILNKPGKLTEEEFDKMKTHTTAGRDILDKAISTVHGESYLMEGRNLAAYHHEKWNGRGYPYGLSGEEIPLSARVMAVADVFDALASKRVYKDAMPFEKAVSIIQEDAGSHFDPLVVEVFMDSLDEVKAVLDYYNSRVTPEDEEGDSRR